VALSRWSLDRLLTWTGTTALMILFVPVAVYILFLSSSSAERSLTERGRGLAESAARQAVTPLLLEDRLTLGEILEATTTANEDVVYACVQSPNGAVVSRGLPGGVPAALVELWAGGNDAVAFRTGDEPVVNVSAPIMSGSLGKIHVGMSRAQAVRTTHRLMLLMGLVLGGALTAVLFGARLVAARVSRPLRQLEARLSHFPQKAPPFGEVAECGTQEEASLGRSFAEMARRLESLETERAATQEKMIHAERLAALGEVAAGLAHEIHNPLDGMLECVRYLDADPQKGPRAAKYLPMIREGLDRVAAVMRQMLTFAHSGHDTSVEECAVPELVDATVLMLQGKLESHGVRLTSNDPGRCLCLVNRQCFGQTVMNLVLNAAAASAENARPEVRIEATCNRQWVYVAVEDNGPGVPEDLREEVFRPFFTTRQPGSGTGLGLSISRELMRAGGGELLLSEERSSLGGARFVMRLPKALSGGSSDV
jgi:signal transduction histidine kinase